MRWNLILLLLFWLGAPAGAQVTDPAEELPPPKPEGSVLANPELSPRSQHVKGWGLIGHSGRHYCVGATALADYVLGGQRYIITLDAEDPANHPTTAESFLYFREASTGHRWAIARYPSADQRYRVYFQAEGSPGVWQLFQRADATWESQLDKEPTFIWTWPEPTCSQLLPTESFFSWP